MTDEVELEAERAHMEIMTRNIGLTIIMVVGAVCITIVTCNYFRHAMPPDACGLCMEAVNEFDCEKRSLWDDEVSVDACLGHVQKQLDKCLTLCSSQGSEEYGPPPD